MSKKIYMLLVIFMIIVLIVPACARAGTTPDPLAEQKSTVSIPEPAQQEEQQSTAIIESDDPPEQDITLPNLEKLAQLEGSFVVKNAFPDLVFDRPLDLQHAQDGSGRLFVVEQGGKIFVLHGQMPDQAQLFLDISARVDSGGEKGLLGLAFHPRFEENGLFFLNYTQGSSTVVAQFSIDEDDPGKADPGSEQRILVFDQPYANHNGGQLAFGPHDHYLYIATGDGGGAGDPGQNSQDRSNLLGNILRIDVDRQDPGLNYAIPDDNPFRGNTEGFREEIFAYGLRNPWRFSFDAAHERLWAADVGQDRIEEINIIEKGGNYGWNIMEGSLCFDPPSGCDTQGLKLPVYEYEHPLGKSVTGGYVYYGQNLPALYGVYLYADFITGYIWGLAYSQGEEVQNFTLAKTGLNISSFGVDHQQEIYFTAFDGHIYTLGLP